MNLNKEGTTIWSLLTIAVSHKSTTSVGNMEYPFDLARLVTDAGAVYTARWSTTDKDQLQNSIEEAIKKGQKGFAFVEIISPCTAQFARRNQKVFQAIKNELKLGKFVDTEREGFVKRIHSAIKENQLMR